MDSLAKTGLLHNGTAQVQDHQPKEGIAAISTEGTVNIFKRREEKEYGQEKEAKISGRTVPHATIQQRNEEEQGAVRGKVPISTFGKGKTGKRPVFRNGRGWEQYKKKQIDAHAIEDHFQPQEQKFCGLKWLFRIGITHIAADETVEIDGAKCQRIHDLSGEKLVGTGEYHIKNATLGDGMQNNNIKSCDDAEQINAILPLVGQALGLCIQKTPPFWL